MRKLVSALSVVLVVVALNACGGNDSKSGNTPSTTSGGSSTEKSATLSPVTANTLTVATRLPAPGYWNSDDPAKVTGGFEYAIAQEIAKRLGLTGGVKVKNVSSDALVSGRAKGFDVGLSQVTITPDAAKAVDFTRPYFSSDQGILVKTGTNVENLAQAKKLTWGEQGSTSGQSLLQDQVKPDSDPKVFQDTPSMIAALEAGQVDAVMLDTSIVLGQAAQSNGRLAVVGQFATGEKYGGVVPKGSKNLEAINRAIGEMTVDGTLAQLEQQWLVPVFKGDPSRVPVISV